MKKTSLKSKLYSLLPSGLSITQEEIDQFWVTYSQNVQTFIDENNFASLFDYMFDTPFFLSQDYIPQHKILIQIIQQFYKIITNFPIQNKLLVCRTFEAACSFSSHVDVFDDLVLEWKPLYRTFKFIFYKEYNSDLYSYDFAIESINFFAHYFPPESTKEIVDKFLPHLCRNSNKLQMYLVIFTTFLPPHGDYNLFLPYFKFELSEYASVNTISYFLRSLSQVFYWHILDNFSSIVPSIFHVIEFLIYHNDEFPYSKYESIFNQDSIFFQQNSSLNAFIYSSRIVSYLLFSPPTRKAAFERLKIIVNRANTLCVDSDVINYLLFLNNITLTIFKSAKSIYKNLPPLPQSLSDILSIGNSPTSPFIHEIVQIIVESRLLLFTKFGSNTIETSIFLRPLSIECYMDPFALKRYSTYANLCIEVTDPPSVAKLGWRIFEAISSEIKDKDTIMELLQKAIFVIEYKELKDPIFHFLFIAFSLYRIDDPKLAVSLFEALINYHRSDDGTHDSSLVFYDHFYHCFFQSCIHSKTVFEALYEYWIQNISDTSLVNEFSDYIIVQIFCSFVQFATPTMVNGLLSKLAQTIKSTRIPDNLYLFTQLYACATKVNHVTHTDYFLPKKFSSHPSNLPKDTVNNYHPLNELNQMITKDEEISILRKRLSVLSQLLKNKDKKIRKIALSGISRSLCTTLLDQPFIWNNELCLISSCFASDLISEILDPYITILETSNDLNEIRETLSISKLFISSYLCAEIHIDPGDVSDVSSFLSYSPGRNSSLEESIPPYGSSDCSQRERICRMLTRLLTEFKNDQYIVLKSLFIVKSYFYLLEFNVNYLMPLKFFNNACWYHSNRVIPSMMVVNNFLSYQYKRFFKRIMPITKENRKLITSIIKLGISKNIQIRETALTTISSVMSFYPNLIAKILTEVFGHFENIPIDEFSIFFKYKSILKVFLQYRSIFCDVFYHVCADINPYEEATEFYIRSGLFTCLNSSQPNFSNQNEINQMKELANKISKLVIDPEKRSSRSFSIFAICIISEIVKYHIELDKNLFDFVIEKAGSNDETIRFQSESVISLILHQKVKMTKEKVEFSQIKPLDSLPSIFDLASVTTTYEHIDSNMEDLADPSDPNDNDNFDQENDNNIYYVDEMNENFNEEIDNDFLEEINNKSMNDEYDNIIKDEKTSKKFVQTGTIRQSSLINFPNHRRLFRTSSYNSVSNNTPETDQTYFSHNKLQEKTSNSIIKAHIDLNYTDEDYLSFEFYHRVGFVNPTHFTKRKYEFFDIPEISENLKSIIYSIIDSNKIQRQIENDDISFSFTKRKLWNYISITLGPKILDSLIPIFQEFLIATYNSKNHSKSILDNSFTLKDVDVVFEIFDILFGIIPNLHSWDKESQIRLYEEILIPFIEAIPFNTNISYAIEEIFLVLSNCLNPILIAPLFVYTSQADLTEISSRNKIIAFGSFLYSMSISSLGSFDTIFENICKPLFKSPNNMSFVAQSISLQIFFALFNSSIINETLLLSHYEKLVQSIKKKSDMLIDAFQDSISHLDIKQKSSSNFLSQFLDIFSALPSSQIAALFPTLLSNMSLMWKIVDNAPADNQEMFLNSFSNFSIEFFFSIKPEYITPFFKKTFDQISLISSPLRIEILNILSIFIAYNETILGRSRCKFYSKIVREVCEGNDFRMQQTAINLIGYLHRSEAINFDEEIVDEDEKQTDNEEMDEILAAAILVNADVFDTVSDELRQAFKIAEENISGKMGKLLDDALKTFWEKNEGSMLSSIEEELSYYAFLVQPSYIS